MRWFEAQPKHKVYNYSSYIAGIDYVLEPAKDEIGWYLTGPGNLKRGDRVIFSDSSGSDYYEIWEIDYYCNVPKLFIALLKKVKRNSAVHQHRNALT